MQRLTKSLLTVLAMLLMLNMVLIAPSYTPSARADNHLDATISHSVELYGDLGLKYNVKLNSSGSYSNMYLRLQRQKFSGSGSSYTWETIDLKNYTVENGEYVFRYYGLRSTEMPNLIRATLYAQSGNVSLISETDEMSQSTLYTCSRSFELRCGIAEVFSYQRAESSQCRTNFCAKSTWFEASVCFFECICVYAVFRKYMFDRSF